MALFRILPSTEVIANHFVASTWTSYSAEIEVTCPPNPFPMGNNYATLVEKLVFAHFRRRPCLVILLDRVLLDRIILFLFYLNIIFFLLSNSIQSCKQTFFFA